MLAIVILLMSAARRALLLHTPTQESSLVAVRQWPVAVRAQSDVATSPSETRNRLSGSLEDALQLAVPLGHGVVLLTFGNAGVKQMLNNFIHHARKCGAPFVIGAVDRRVFELLEPAGVAVYETPLAKRKDYALDGSNTHASGSWMSFAQMRSGEVARVVALGL